MLRSEQNTFWCRFDHNEPRYPECQQAVALKFAFWANPVRDGSRAAVVCRATLSLWTGSPSNESHRPRRVRSATASGRSGPVLFS